MILVIMAAGMGSRFGGLKQIEPIDENGNFLIDYSVFDAIRSGFNHVIFIIRKEHFKLFDDSIGCRIKKFVKVDYVFQENDDIIMNYPRFSERKKPLGTGHAIYLLKNIVNDNFAVINADDFYGENSYYCLSNFFKQNTSQTEFALISFNLNNTLSPNGTVKRGICNTENGYLKSITECKIDKINGDLTITRLSDGKPIMANPEASVSMNMFGFTTKVFDYLSSDFESFLKNEQLDANESEFFLPDVISLKVKQKLCKVKVINSESKWLGMTYKDDLQNIKSKIKKLTDMKVYPKNLWK